MLSSVMPASSVGIPQFALPVPGKSAVQIGVGLALAVAAYGFYVKARRFFGCFSSSCGIIACALGSADGGVSSRRAPRTGRTRTERGFERADLKAGLACRGE